MANIKTYLNNIKTAVFGSEVRDSIHDAIQQCYDDASAKDNANMEVKMARGEYENLGKRLDSHSSQIKEKASKSELEVERQRINNLTSLPEGSTIGDAELIDARVGIDGVIYDNLGTGVRTQFAKIKKTITDTKVDMENRTITYEYAEVVATNKYATIVDSSITYTDAEGFNVYKVPFNANTKWIMLNKTMSSGTYPIYVNAKNEVSYITKNNVRLSLNEGYILFNRSSSNGYDSVTIQEYKTKYPYVDLTNKLYYKGLMQNGIVSDSNTYQCYKITDLSHDYYEKTWLPVLGSCFDSNDNYLGELSKIQADNGNFVLNYPQNTNYFVINQSLYDDAYDLMMCDKLIISNCEDVIIGHTTKRYNFTNKSITLLGDSIAYGTEGTNGTRCENRWINLFTQNTGAICNNIAQGGATISRKTSNSILNQAQDNTLDTDFIFVAGGTNDYGNSVSLGLPDSTSDQDLYGAMNILCKYFKENYATKKIIFILPINRCGLVENNITLNQYRKVIREVAIKNKYEVIDGSLFGFPNLNENYRNTIIPDGVHPSEVGHFMYDCALENAICI